MAPTKITIRRPDSQGRIWISVRRGNAKSVSTFSYHYEGALEIAQRAFKDAGGEGKAVIIDFADPKGRADA
jgi:hypothetical protein